MCIWKVEENERHCQYCGFDGTCERTLERLPEISRIAGRLASVMSDIIGENILYPSRKAELVWGRYFVAYELRHMGYSYPSIGRAIEKNHATVIYYIKQVRKMLSTPCFYEKEMAIWKEFKERLSLEKL